MTTEITSPLPPCPLPDCEGGEHHYHRTERHPGTPEGMCTQSSVYITRCYGAHQPAAPIRLPEITDEIADAARTAWGLKSSWDSAEDRARRRWRAVAVAVRDALLASIPQWQPIEHDQIKAGMRIRATIASSDRTSTYTGVVHHIDEDGDWRTARGWKLTGWFNPSTYEVDPSTIPADPDAELIEAIGKAIHDADFSCDDAWGEDGTEDAYRKLARAALNVIRESEATA